MDGFFKNVRGEKGEERSITLKFALARTIVIIENKIDRVLIVG